MRKRLIITGNRGDGKTLKLIKYTNMLVETGHKVIVLVLEKGMKEIYHKKGLLDEALVLSYSEYMETPERFGVEEEFDLVIDDLPDFLDVLLHNRVSVMTINREELLFLDRASWE